MSAQQTVVLEVAGVHWASAKGVTESVLGRRPGVIAVEANPVGQTATVTYDPARTSVRLEHSPHASMQARSVSVPSPPRSFG
jgi:copper chaperone CopZ